MNGRWAHLTAALLLLVSVLFLFRSVLPDPAHRLPLPERHTERRETLVYRADQSAVVGMLGLQAQAMLSRPFSFTQKASCFPLTRPHTLGEHMFGEALLGAVPQAITGNPVITFNVVTVLHLWIAAIAMYALAFYWTGSVPAALVAALLFALHPLRSTNPAHMFATGNIWAPLALLAAHRLMHGGRWSAALGLAAVLVLQLLESFYQVLGLALLGGVYGVHLAWRHRTQLRARLPQLLLVAAVVGAALYLIFEPYFHARATWNILQGRQQITLLSAGDYLPGGDSSMGLLALVLALAGLADRIRRPRLRDGTDPRLPLLLAATVVFLFSISTLPGLGLQGPIFFARDWIPGLDGIRVIRVISVGVLLVVDLFAAYGLLALLELVPGRGRLAAGGLAVTLVFAELAHPGLSARSFGRTSSLGSVEAGISPELEALYQQVPDGAVLDLPANFGPWRKIADGPIYLTGAGFHGQPAAACYNSFSTDVQKGIEQLASLLPDPDAADALHALGFRTLALHEDRGDSDELQRLRELLADPARIQPIGHADTVHLFRLDSDLEIVEDPGVLLVARVFDYAHPLTETRQWIPIYMRNEAAHVFRHPEPIEPSPANVVWRDMRGEKVAEGKAFVFLPLALASGAEMGRGVQVDVPALPPGTYHVHISLEARPEVPLGSTRVRIARGSGRPDPS